MANESETRALGAIEAALVEMAERAGRSGVRAGRVGGSRAERFRVMQQRMGSGAPVGGGPASDPGVALRGLMVEAGRVFASNRAAFREMALRGFDEVVARQSAARADDAVSPTGPEKGLAED